MKYSKFLLSPILAGFACMPLLSVQGKGISKSLAKEAQQLSEAALEENIAYEVVESLTTEVGARLAGSEAEKRARSWAVAKLKELGFENVHVEPFEVPLWERGIERAEIVSPFPQQLTVTALGGSVATPEEGVVGELIRFSSVKELENQPQGSLKGKIVFIDEIMTRTQDGSGYGVAVGKRRQTAYEAYKKGAAGALIRSVGTSSHRFAHTGQMKTITEITEEIDSVPTAALSAPDADQLTRALERTDNIQIRLQLTPKFEPASISGNVVGEIVGTESPEEVIIIGGHLDSWDLGTGAIDDGAGIGITVAAARLIKDHYPNGLKRTIRIVMWGSEEVGLVGAKAYADAHADELHNFIVAAESDFGAGKIWKFNSFFAEEKLNYLSEIADVLRPLGIAKGDNKASSGPDVGALKAKGVPIVSLQQNGWDYFDLHHTPNDTLDKINPEELAQNVAAYAAFVFLAAQIEDDFRAEDSEIN
ncbi:M28 family peptidase [Opitutia bacterium ISCC 51]|nr:M28 family peptidase [Opitutae bacterium ISCC 51]QXD29569.1 M28 family peptidase [Opitutae bacterium ISCC 52]